MRERILEIIRNETVTSTRFADKIGVQRSSVSHVINGRNKPGFDFIHKILIAFPNISAEWLLTDKGNMYKSKSKDPSMFIDGKVIEHKELEKKEAYESKEKKAEFRNNKDEFSQKRKDIEKILVFYKDKTFNEYFPES